MEKPDPTAIRTALWRALHLEVDAPPHIIDDAIGVQLAAPDENWRERPDMHPQGTRGYRASIVGRARFIEDLVTAQAGMGVTQYVILGAGLDTFAQRRSAACAKLHVFEIDRPEPQAWKQRRLRELGFDMPASSNHSLAFVPVDFEAGESWWDKLQDAGFDAQQPAVVASTGVSPYLSREANLATLRQLATLAPGSTLAMTFLLPLELIEPPDVRAQHAAVYERARAAGTPFLSFFRPAEILALALTAGFPQTEHVSSEEIVRRYFADRKDGLRPAQGEDFLIAGT
jgi:methyltransferase (TIGR00027 family)